MCVVHPCSLESKRATPIRKRVYLITCLQPPTWLFQLPNWALRPQPLAAITVNTTGSALSQGLQTETEMATYQKKLGVSQLWELKALSMSARQPSWVCARLAFSRTNANIMKAGIKRIWATARIASKLKGSKIDDFLVKFDNFRLKFFSFNKRLVFGKKKHSLARIILFI